MTRFKIQDLRLMIFILLSVLFVNLKSSTVNQAFAADSTSSADWLRHNDSGTGIKSKLEELRREIASKAAALKQEVNTKLSNKAYIGKIKAKSNATLTLATKNGQRTININQDTIYQNQAKGKKYSQKSLTEEDNIAALGDIDETQVLTAKEIILLNPKLATITPKSYLWGEITIKSDQLITLNDRNLKSIAVSLPDQRMVKQNNFVILTGNFNKNEIFEADFVYVIPQGGFIKPRKLVSPAPDGAGATPSAKPKIATPSGTTK